MAENTNIEWCTHTFNPWWGCTKVAAGCKNCYADTFANRYGFNVWGAKAERRFFGDKHWSEPIKWNKLARESGERRRVFCGSMCDVCEDRDDLIPHRVRLDSLIRCTPWLDWQLLSKRPENYARFFPSLPENVWAGCSIAEQRDADANIPALQAIKARVRFLSCEPLIEAVTLDLAGIHWVIVGGESGAGRRPCDPEWFESIAKQCEWMEVPLFVKQDGGLRSGTQGRLSDALWSRKAFP